jgi:hypothetical protein
MKLLQACEGNERKSQEFLLAYEKKLSIMRVLYFHDKNEIILRREADLEKCSRIAGFAKFFIK